MSCTSNFRFNILQNCIVSRSQIFIPNQVTGTTWLDEDVDFANNLTISASSSNHSAAIKTDGSLWLWGAGGSGQLGTNAITNRSSPVQTVSGGTNWKQVSLGDEFSAAIKTDGSLWLWGLGSDGQLGTNDTSYTSSPVQTVSGGNNWKQVSLGNAHSAAIKTDGTLWMWGCANEGQLGTNTTTNQSSPVQTVSGGNDWKQVSLGFYHSAAIKTDGSLWLWGAGSGGRLGTNTTTNQSSPVQTVSGGNDWKQVDLGGNHTMATKSDCTLFMWGRNNYGQLATDLSVDCGMQLKPYDFDDVFVRKEFFSEGGLWLWGDNTDGQLGDRTIIAKSSPVQTISGGTNWKQVATGVSGQASHALKYDGTLWNWGNNGVLSGRLGDNTTINRSSPVQTVSGGTNWQSVAAGSENGIGIKTDGTLWIWGADDTGKLGRNTESGSTGQSSPIQTIAGGTNWLIADGGDDHNAAIKTDGTLWLWGSGGQGRLGDNNAIDRSSPVQTVSGGTNWKQICLSGTFSAAIKTDGTLWSWGNNSSGQLGNNNVNVNQSSPVQTVSGGTNWKQVAVSLSSMSAIKTDGTLWVWGSGGAGILGTNAEIDQSSPVQTVSGGTNWKQVSMGCRHAAAIKTDGTLWLWGTGTGGQLGNNNAVSQSSPVQTVSGGTNWKFVSTGGDRTLGIREDCW